MRTLRGQLVLSHILPFLLVLPLITLALLVLIETQVLLTSLTQRATEQDTLLAQAVRRQLEVLDNPDLAQSFVASLAVSLDGRVLLLSPDGQALASVGLEGDRGNQFLRPAGIDTALQGETSILVSYGLDGQGVEVLAPIIDASGRVVGMVGVIKTLTGLGSLVGRLRQIMIAALLLELVLGVVIGLALARRLARPIDATASAVVDLAEGRPMDPVAEQGPREIRQLANAANVLAERLRLLEETRRRSLANVVHEIGRPLGAVRSAVHVLRGPTGADPAIREELLGGVEAQIEGMQPVLDDLAQLHGQVSGGVTLHRRPVAVSEWLPPVLLPWRAAALDKGLDWLADVPARLPTLNVDPERLAQVIGNLLSNAIKYTPAGGRLDVTAGADEEEVWLRVADNGPGIAAEEQQRVFEPFYRSERDRRFPQGLGLGLTIARDLALAHGGRLELDSQSGQGSRFTLYLPLA
ncbi:MAG TPA: ATP-binding protein [Anaerolineae bacterium]|nr:ATP-binding protein [Anaerolineae bacterium]